MILIPDLEYNAIQADRPAEFEIFGVERLHPDGLHVRGDAGRLTLSEVAGNSVIGLATWSTAHMDILRSAHDWIRARGGLVLEPVPLTGSPNVTQLILAMLRQSQTVITAQATQIVAASRSLTALRAEHEQLQVSFAELEDVMRASQVELLHLVFESEPESDLSMALETGNRASQGIRQLLPLSSTGIGAIEIYASGSLPPGDRLEVALWSPEDHRVHGLWQLGAQHLHDGRQVLTLAQALAGKARDLVLDLTWKSRRPSGLVLRLAAPHPLHRYTAKWMATSAPAANAPLAMRIWCGTPGRSVRGAIRSDDATTSGLSRVLRLGAADLRRVVPVIAEETTSVQFVEDETAILCQPPRSGTTVARLRGTLPASTLRVTAEITVDHPRAHPVEFALAVEQGRDSDRGAEHSGWHRVVPGEAQCIEVVLGEPLVERRSLLLATRMADGALPDFAWAKFRRIEVVR